MYVEKMRGEPFFPANSAKSKLIIFDKAAKIDIVTSMLRKTGEVTLSNFKRISKDSYVNIETGEVFEYKRSTKKTDNIFAVKRSLNKIRTLVLNNFNAFEGFFITLTYHEPMFDFDIVAKDFAKFYDKLKYYYSSYRFDYLRLIEPQESGSWHIHIVIKSAIENQQIKITESVILKAWKFGSVKVSQIYDTEGLAKYLGTYNNSNNKKVTSKTMEKQNRWHYYPPGVKIFTKSKGIKYPDEVAMSYGTAKEILHDYELVSEPVSYCTINDSGKVVNIVSYESHKRKNKLHS